MPDLRGIRSVDELDLNSRRVLIRADLDVRLDDESRVIDDAPLRAVIETVRFAAQTGARVIVAGHRGEPDGREDPALSVEPVAARLSELSGFDVFLPDDSLSDAAKKVILDLREGQICVLENLAFYPGELTQDEAFSRQLASYADVYVNDAFGASALSYASVCVLPKLVRDRAVGKGLALEMSVLGGLREAAADPLALIVGGDSLSSQLDLVEALLSRTQTIAFGAGPGLTLLAATGATVPMEDVEQDSLSRARSLLSRALDKGVKILLPTDWGSDSAVRDVGPLTVERYARVLETAGTAIVTGSLGSSGSAEPVPSNTALAKALAASPAFTIVATDDTQRFLAALSDEERAMLNHISTNGRAARLLLSGRSLPGIEALKSGGTAT